MADLTTKLPTEMDSAQRFVQPAPATPSPLTSIFDFAGKAASVADKAWTTLDRNAKEGAAAKRQAGIDQADNSATLAVANLFSDPSMAPKPSIPPGSENAAANAQPLATTAANAQTAAAQGHIDPAMAQVKSIAAFRQALAANPGHEYAVFQVFKAAGVDNMMTQQYNNAEKGIEDNESAQRTAVQKLQSDAVNKYGYSDFFQHSPQDQAVILARVGEMNAQETELDAATKRASLVMQNHTLTQDEQTQVQKQTSQDLLGKAQAYMTTSFSNFTKTWVNMAADPTLANDPGRFEKLQSHLVNVGIPALDLQYQTRMAQIAPYLTPDDRSQLDKMYQQQRQSIVDAVSGPQSVVQMNQRVLQNISTSANIDYAKSAPTLMKVQKMIGAQALGVLLSPSVTGNKPLMDMLSNELRGAITDPTKVASFTEFVQSLNGTVDPSTWDPQKMASIAPASLAAMARLATDSATSNGTDKQAHQALVNSIKNTAGVAVDVVPQWGFDNVLMQGKALNTRGVTTSMFATNANTSERLDAIRSWIPANTRSYETLASMKSGDNFYTAKLDPHTLQWSAVWNGKYAGSGAGNDGIVQLTGGRPDNIKPSPSSAVLEQVSTLNHMLNNLSDSASKGYDDSLGDKHVPYSEARRYFATGEQPASLAKPATTKNGKTPEQNVDDAISHMLDFVNKLPTPKAPEDLTKMPLANTVTQAAAAHGVPTAIALRLIHQESGGNPNVHPSDKGAVGPGQIMPATAAGYGKDVTKLTPEENVDLAMQILADNYKKTGNWEDAVSMYHSGRTLADAVKHGSNDGHISTADYTASVAGVSSISPENLARYGYVRY